jgi:hypothetical protein
VVVDDESGPGLDPFMVGGGEHLAPSPVGDPVLLDRQFDDETGGALGVQRVEGPRSNSLKP